MSFKFLQATSVKSMHYIVYNVSCIPPLGNPSCLQATFASSSSHKRLQILFQALLLQISMRPRELKSPTSRRAPCAQELPVIIAMIAYHSIKVANTCTIHSSIITTMAVVNSKHITTAIDQSSFTTSTFNIVHPEGSFTICKLWSLHSSSIYIIESTYTKKNYIYCFFVYETGYFNPNSCTAKNCHS